jgi:hypothetical protein
MGEDDEYARAQDLLSSLISGKRGDGAQWAHAFDMMQIYLEVSVGPLFHTMSTFFPTLYSGVLKDASKEDVCVLA